MAIRNLSRCLVLLGYLICYLPARGQQQRVSQAQQGRNAACALEYSASKLYLRELTGHNDNPEIDAWARATGTALRSPWCGLFQWAVNTSCGLPVPAGPAGSYNWVRPESPRTFYIRDRRGTLDSLKPTYKVGLYYANLGRVGHILLMVKPARPVRRGRPVRGYVLRSGNTGSGGGRDGAGVKDVMYAATDIYAASNWNY